ncbi:Spy0128 family protein [Collinsella bouchesdurhonensis]|uniref:Spy0128 family protein n=1 Tax=Collinsella bouchesdurhonensis TaxID=1907654 RepID=UPI00069368DC|nr:FctA domain-containing protein [Collinsella bouchesdurhonensis]
MELKRSIRTRAARLVAMFAMALVCALVLVPSAYADGAVARIDETEYNTFDEAVADAKNGETVTLLADAETAGLDLSKNLTIDGGGNALKFTDKGIALRGKALTFKNVNVTMTGIGSTPAVVDNGWTWMTICASKDASLTLDDATLTMDGADAGNVHAIYFCSNNKLNLKNGSNLTIKNYKQDALEWDGGDGGYNVNIETGSTYTSDHCRSGFTGTFVVTVDKSKVNVVNSTGNGSNGSHFNIKNDSTVDFSGNGSHGLSAGNLTIDNSTVTAKDNALTGIIFTGKGEFKSANVQISGTKGTSYWNAGMRLLKANASLDVDAASTVSITGNKVTGLYLDGGSHATFAEGAKLTITGNDASQENCSTKKDAARMGGGVMVRSNASLSLPASAKIDNNHAALAGDDLCAEQGATISFGKTVEGDTLTDFNGCGDAITGWFDDSKDARWCAHWTDNTPWHVKAVEADSYETPVALKAAHGVTAAHAEIAGTKVLKGAQLAEGDFEFTLSQNDDVISHAKNAADGSFTFGESAFDVTADDIMHTDNHKVSYTLDVAEVKGNKANVTYDTSVKKVVVTAVPEDDHVKLTYSVDGKDVEDLASALVFTNTYTKPAEPSEPKTPGASTKQNLPKTGDVSLAAPVAFILAAAVACGAGVVMRRRG